jgi:hypothetical protein
MQEASRHSLEHRHKRLVPSFSCNVGKNDQDAKNSQVLELSSESQEILPVSELEVGNSQTYSQLERSLFLLIFLLIAALGLVISAPLWLLAKVAHSLGKPVSKE